MINQNPILLSIIVPVFNEEKTIKVILEKLSNLKKKNSSIEIIVINDGSNDNTLSIIKSLDDHYEILISDNTNRGKGYAVKKGIEVANGKYITFQDGDLEFEPNDLLKFFSVIEKFDPDLIIGSRFNYPDYTRSINLLNKFGNLVITLTFNLLYNTTFTDIYSCYICFKKELLDVNKLKTNGFEQQAEILTKVVRKGKKFYEVPINYNGRSHEEGKKIKFYHIFPVLFRIMIGRF